MPKSSKGTPSKPRQRLKRERGALRILRKSVELQVRLAYARIPSKATALSQARLDVRASLVSRGFLTVEELESLARRDAMRVATQRVTEQVRSTPPGKHQERA